MYEAYAIVFTTLHVIATLMVIGAVCWAVGKYRAQLLWDREDELCDSEDERAYATKQISQVNDVNGLFDFSDKELIDEEDPRGYVCDPSGGSWLCAVSKLQRLWDEPEA